MVYAMHLERIERAVVADRQIAATFMAAGAKDVQMPTLDEAREAFDAALLAEVVPGTTLDREQLELRRVLGVAS